MVSRPCISALLWAVYVVVLGHIGWSTILREALCRRRTWMLFWVMILAVLSVKRRCLLSALEELNGRDTIGCFVCL